MLTIDRWKTKFGGQLNLALFNIRGVSKSMSEMRLCIRDDVVGHRALINDMPVWALARTWIYRPTDDLNFDYDSLTFLLDSEGGRKAVLHLRYAEEIYKAASHIYELNQEKAREYKIPFSKAIDLHVTSQNVVNWSGLGKAIGETLVLERESYFNAMLYSTEIDIDEIKIAFDLMMSELARRFKGDAWKLEFFPSLKSNRHETKLPAYPEDIIKLIEERKAEKQRAMAGWNATGS
jgi:hypothetical protein